MRLVIEKRGRQPEFESDPFRRDPSSLDVWAGHVATDSPNFLPVHDNMQHCCNSLVDAVEGPTA